MSDFGKSLAAVAVVLPGLSLSVVAGPRTHWLVADASIVEKSGGASQVLEAPVAHADNPLLEMDTPVEAGSGRPWFNIILDPHEKFYKAWYGRDGCCYGTSHNGLLWNKPLLDLNPDAAGGKTSLLMKGVPSAAVLRDDPDPDSSRLFKLLASSTRAAEVRFSEDGIRFGEPKPVNLPALSSRVRPTVLRGADGGYVAFFAQDKKGSRGDVILHRSTSADFVKWSAPEPVEWPGSARPRSFTVVRHADMYWAFTGVAANAADGLRVGFGVSPDGRKWAVHGPANAAEPVHAAIPLREEVRLFFTREAALHLATLRPDGFAGLASTDKPATVVMRPVNPPGGKLRLTADVREGGSISVEAADAGPAIPAVKLEKSGTNEVTSMSLPAGGAPVRLKFTLKNATLYGFSFGDRSFP